MSGVRQCLEDSLQLQIQRVSASWTTEQPCTAGMSRCVGRLSVPMAGNYFQRHEFVVIMISCLLKMFCHQIFSCGAHVGTHTRLCVVSAFWRQHGTIGSKEMRGDKQPSSCAPPRHGCSHVVVNFPQPSQRSGGTFPAALIIQDR